jgi:integrase
MKASNIPYLYCRNGIYYYRNQTVWKSLKTRCKKEAFRKLSFILFGTSPALNDTIVIPNNTVVRDKATQLTTIDTSDTLCSTSLIDAYLLENGVRWCAREYTRVKNSLAFLPKGLITKEIAIQLKATILKIKTVTTFNRYLKYFNVFYRWLLANNTVITENPFEGLKVIEKRKNISAGRKAYTPEQLKELFKLAERYGKNDRRYWLIMIGRFMGARMNEICQLKPEDITLEAIHIRGAVLKTSNAKRSIPTHPKLIELGLLDWVGKCRGGRLFYEWKPVKGSFSHQASRWFSRNNPSKSGVIGEKAEVDFHSLRHTVATELKNAGVSSQYAAQILGHSNGNITYDRYGKNINYQMLKSAVEVIGLKCIMLI